MDIGKFAKKPELIKITLDKPEIIETFGSEIFFWVYDNLDISTYFKFYKSQADQDGAALNEVMRKLILTADGKPALKDEEMLPIELNLAALAEINEVLGKSKTKLSTPTTGEQQNS